MKHWLNTHGRLWIRQALGKKTHTLNIATFPSQRWQKSLLYSSSWKLYQEHRRVGPTPSAAPGTWADTWVLLLKLTPGSRVPQGWAHSLNSLLWSPIFQLGMGDPHQALNSPGATSFPYPKSLLLLASQATKYTSHALESQRAGMRGALAPKGHSTWLLEAAEQSQAAFKWQAGHPHIKVWIHIQKLFLGLANTQLLNLRGNKFDRQRTKSLGSTSPAPHDESWRGNKRGTPHVGTSRARYQLLTAAATSTASLEETWLVGRMDTLGF